MSPTRHLLEDEINLTHSFVLVYINGRRKCYMLQKFQYIAQKFARKSADCVLKIQRTASVHTQQPKNSLFRGGASDGSSAAPLRVATIDGGGVSSLTDGGDVMTSAELDVGGVTVAAAAAAAAVGAAAAVVGAWPVVVLLLLVMTYDEYGLSV